MADKTSINSELVIDMYFVDGDTRLLKLPNPADTITVDQITSLQSLIRANNLLIGDKGGAAFGRITTVDKVYTTKVEFDLSTT